MCKKWYGKIHIKLPTLIKGISFKCYRLISFEQHYFSDLQEIVVMKHIPIIWYICVCLYDLCNIL